MSPSQSTIMCFAVILAFLVLPSYAFRPDYIYVETTGSHYKLHRQSASWTDARSMCQSEGALLFYPENEAELNLILILLGVERESKIHIGMSDLKTLKVYETVDGRPISQVYNEWLPNQPDSGTKNSYRCGCLNVSLLKLYVSGCEWDRKYICKHYEPMVSLETKVIEEVKGIIANSSEQLAVVLERQAENQTTAFEILEQHVKDLQLQTAKHTTALNHLSETMQQQAANQAASMKHLAEVVQLQIANQTTVFKRLEETIHEQTANQTTAIQMETDKLNQLATISQEQAANQITAIEQLIVNQTAALGAQALALEKLAGVFPAYTSALHMLAAPIKVTVSREDNKDSDPRSQQ